MSTALYAALPRLPLYALLSDRGCYSALYSFARTEHSEETVAFIDAVEALRRQCDAFEKRGDDAATNPTLIAAAEKIYRKFAPDAEYAIVWDPIIIKRLQSQLNDSGHLSSPFELFPQEEREINLLKTGNLQRFYQSKEYRNLIDGLTTRLSGDWNQLHSPESDVCFIGGARDDKATSIYSKAMATRSRFEEHKEMTVTPSPAGLNVTIDTKSSVPANVPKLDSDGAMYIALSPSHSSQAINVISPLSPSSTRRAYISVAADSEMAAVFETFNSNPLGVQILRSFMITEFSVDNYDFVLSIIKLQSRYLSLEEIRARLLFIYATFLEKNSKHEVTFPSPMRKELQKIFNTNSDALAAADVHVFDAIAYVVMSTIKTDIMRRFVRSTVYQEMIKDFAERNRERRDETQTKLPSPSPTARNSAILSLSSSPLSSPKSESSAVSLDFVLNDDDLLHSFHHFCQREHSDENIRLYVAVRDYRKAHKELGDRALVEQGDIFNIAHKVFTDFIEPTAPFLVTLSSDIRNAIQVDLYSGRGDIFDDAVNCAIDRMRTDSFARYLRSNDYAAAMRIKQAAHSQWGLTSLSKAVIRKVSTFA